MEDGNFIPGSSVREAASRRLPPWIPCSCHRRIEISYLMLITLARAHLCTQTRASIHARAHTPRNKKVGKLVSTRLQLIHLNTRAQAYIRVLGIGAAYILRINTAYGVPV